MTDAAVAVAVAPLVVGAVDVDAASRVWTGWGIQKGAPWCLKDDLTIAVQYRSVSNDNFVPLLCWLSIEMMILCEAVLCAVRVVIFFPTGKE